MGSQIQAEQTPLPVVGAAAACAGLSISLLTCPVSRIKVVQQARALAVSVSADVLSRGLRAICTACHCLSPLVPGHQLCGGGFMATAHALYLEGTLYRGITATALWETSRGIYMMAYVHYKRVLGARQPPSVHGEPPAPPLWARVVAGASANTTCWLVMYPVDVCRTLQQSTPIGHGAVAPPGVLGSLRAMLSEGGVARLYRGFGLTLLRAGPVSGVLLPLFDLTLAALERLSGAAQVRSVWRRPGETADPTMRST